MHREGDSSPPGAVMRKERFHLLSNLLSLVVFRHWWWAAVPFDFARLAAMPLLSKVCVAPFVWMLGCGTMNLPWSPLASCRSAGPHGTASSSTTWVLWRPGQMRAAAGDFGKWVVHTHYSGRFASNHSLGWTTWCQVCSIRFINWFRNRKTQVNLSYFSPSSFKFMLIFHPEVTCVFFVF